MAANSRQTPPAPMYSLLSQAVIGDPLVTHVKVITSPGHTRCVGEIVLLIIIFSMGFKIAVTQIGMAEMVQI